METITAPVHLGDLARDVITGYQGIITGECRYLTGCEQVLISPPVGEDGKLRDGHWFDADRIEVIAAGSVRLGNAAAELPEGVATISRSAAGPDIAPPDY